MQRPCDLYAPATPCVAAFSTTRSLYAAYSGALYQVTRQSDTTSFDVTLLPDGYANAAAQDTFCANSTCTITKIYDQTPNHNDLTVAPPGGRTGGPGPNGYDLPAVANALPVTAGGHSVYGISIVPGMGYRNDITKGVAVNGQPEGVYMVASGIPVNGKCCFDFGNAESNNMDNGAGTMDAISLNCTKSIGNPCKTLTFAGLDMENGILGNLYVPTGNPFVTAMGANNGQTSYTVWQGDAQSGPLTTTGPTMLPPNYYMSMNQEGGIILGIGGQNDNYAAGSFFEGVMTSDAPTDTVMNNVQANIVQAGYSGLPTPVVGSQNAAS